MWALRNYIQVQWQGSGEFRWGRGSLVEVRNLLHGRTFLGEDGGRDISIQQMSPPLPRRPKR